MTKLLDGVTPGPWGAEYDDYGEEIWFGGEGCGTWTVGPCFIGGDGHDPDLARIMDANARFISAARDLVPALLAERDALKAEVDRLKAQTSQAVKVKPLRYFDPQGYTLDQMQDHARQHPLAKKGDMKLVWANEGDLCNHVLTAIQSVQPVTVQDHARVEHVAFSLWKAEAERAAPNVARNRTPEMFLGELESTRAKWLSLADAALRAITEGKA